MPDKKEIDYRTSDIYFSAYLMGMDMNFVAMEDGRNERGQSKKVFLFHVPSKSEIDRLKAQYFGGTGSVKCRRFVDNLKSLKSMLHT